MESYIQIEKMFSKKKNQAYLLTYMCFGDEKYLIKLPNEVIAILLNIRIRDVFALEVGFKSKKIILGIED